jgi:hypothetical protein
VATASPLLVRLGLQLVTLLQLLAVSWKACATRYWVSSSRCRMQQDSKLRMQAHEQVMC